jgi:hypothetical protein
MRFLAAAGLRPPVPEREEVAAGGADHTLQVLDLKTDVVVASLTGHSKKVNSVAFASPTTLLSASADKTVKLWSCGDGGTAGWALRAASLGSATAAVTRVCMHPVRSLAVAVAADASWQMLDVDAERTVWNVRTEAAGSFLSAAVHPDGNFFAAGGEAGSLHVYDVKTAEALMTISNGVAGGVSDVSFNENGFWVALACGTGVQARSARLLSVVIFLQRHPNNRVPFRTFSLGYEPTLVPRHVQFCASAALRFAGWCCFRGSYRLAWGGTWLPARCGAKATWRSVLPSRGAENLHLFLVEPL